MDIFECIGKRHSYRGSYRGTPIPKEDLEKIVDCGLKAPSGKNMQTTEFVVVHSPEAVSMISRLQNASKAMQQARAYILCVVDKKPEAVYEGFSFQLEDCAAAVENMLLAITALGYASVWVDGWLRVDKRAETIAGYAGLPENKKIQVILPVGVPADEVRGPKKKGPSEKVRFV